jgi:hypothetical protein
MVVVGPLNNLGPSDAQWTKLIDYLSCDREMRTGYFEGPHGKVRLERKWREAAVEINKLGNAKKTGEKWKEVSEQFVVVCKFCMLVLVLYVL